MTKHDLGLIWKKNCRWLPKDGGENAIIQRLGLEKKISSQNSKCKTVVPFVYWCRVEISGETLNKAASDILRQRDPYIPSMGFFHAFLLTSTSCDYKLWEYISTSLLTTFIFL